MLHDLETATTHIARMETEPSDIIRAAFADIATARIRYVRDMLLRASLTEVAVETGDATVITPTEGQAP
jgi:16S rRNA C967 or C1407 C5-methylase (RsmB/RsmF family)